MCPVQVVLDSISVRGAKRDQRWLQNPGSSLSCGPISVVGLPQGQYAGDSFRIGAATTLVLRGVNDTIILSRWTSKDFLQYIRMLKIQFASMSPVLAQGGSTCN